LVNGRTHKDRSQPGLITTSEIHARSAIKARSGGAVRGFFTSKDKGLNIRGAVRFEFGDLVFTGLCRVFARQPGKT